MLRLLLPFLLLLPLHALTKPDCVDLICQSKDGHRLGLLEGTRHRQELIDLEGKTIDRCRSCEDCTSSGYSVCIQPRHFEVHRRLFHTGRSCECAHSGPSVSILPPTPPPQQPAAAQNGTAMCRLMPRDGSRPGQQVREVPELKTGEMFFQLCYASALRKLPMPRASNEKEEEEGAADAAAATPPGSGHHVLVTVEQFWLADYWQALRPKQLQLFYVFPVKDRDHCEGLVMAPSVQDLMWINAAKTREQINKAAMSWLCRANLGIAMNGLEQAAAEERRAAESGEPRGIEDAEEYYDNADPDLPPEVQFERDVFAGADRVRFYYELIVHRENQLKAGPGGKVKFEPRDTLIKSESLDFELHPEIYGTGMARSRSQGHVAGPEVRKVNIEKHKDKMDLTREKSPRDPIVLPAGGRSRSGGRSGEGQRTSPTSSSSATRPIQSRPAASSAHAMDGPSTAVPAPSSTERELESPDDFTDSMAGEQSPTGGGTSSKSPSSQPSGGDEPAAEDWLMLRNVVIVFLLLLALFFLVVLCYKRHLCCFTKRASSSGSSANGGAQQRNGKPVIRVQNGKEYREPGK